MSKLKMKTKIKKVFKCEKLTLVMCIITILIGIGIYTDTAIGIPIKENLIIFFISFFPFLIFLLIAKLSYKSPSKNKKYRTITIILSLILIFYYFVIMFLSIFLAAINPVTNPKYYNYYVKGEKLEKVFPSKIPNEAKNINFYYAPGILQGGTMYSLYYVNNNMTKEMFDKKYKSKAIWIGKIDEYKDKEGLLTGVFSYTPSYNKNENDYTIYLIEGRCDNSGYCNHGSFLIAAFNEKTSEVVFCSQDW